MAKRREGQQWTFSIPLWAISAVGIVFLTIVILAGMVLYRIVEGFAATEPSSLASFIPLPSLSESDNILPLSQDGDVFLDHDSDSPAPVELAGIRPETRVTLLLLGIDQPCKYVAEPNRSDTMILLTIDPLSKSASILSLPRDLWVLIPGFDTGRINSAYWLGEIYEYPGGGPQLSLETVQFNLGVQIHHYVTINYEGFIQAIDLIGGIDINAPEAINDPDYPDQCSGFDPFFLTAGPTHLDGETALKYARTRATYGADFDRAERQQAVMMATLDKVLSQNVALLARAPELWDAFTYNIVTSMTYQETMGLAILATEIPPENISHSVINHNYVQNASGPGGQQVLIPIRERIRELRDRFLSTPVPSMSQD